MKKLNTYCSIGCLSVVLSILSSCSTSRQEFDISYKLIPVDARWDKTPEPLMEQIVDKHNEYRHREIEPIHGSGQT